MPAELQAVSGLAAFLEATVRIATPLGLAAVGETITERSGVINIGIEGAMLCGALSAALAGHATQSAAAGFAAGALAGLAVSAVFAFFAIRLRADQIVVGTAISLGATGLTGAVYRAAFGTTGAAMTLPTVAPFDAFGLSALPIVGPMIFHQTAPTWILFAVAPAAWYYLTRTQHGLALRATGEAPAAARAAGLRVGRIRMWATLFGGLLAGLGGATLVLAQAGTFAERMTAGRGFIAIAIVVLGRWNPLGVLGAAMIFGAASALQYAFQAMGLDAPYQFLLMAPYVATLLALAGAFGRARAPEALGKP
jgi:ABC-type uncharacterized transport system permease subunit